ncbi:hypothetical protein ATK17_0992 [Branchiibius hedensis]|uniref:Phosphodiesterase n=1 Tax=Branchiibius hedensis TaxID=672460 RepID=A0A2Y8ZQP1_9MICO|nr:hypothetical protein ATK17_0992 [Branchiibius hedensis]SSA33706.1 hypothetical protein SAMN04489750_0992 [Branchiibius hedensis]
MATMSVTRQVTSASLPKALVDDISNAGYYPALVCDVVAAALGGDQVVSHLVHCETTFDASTVRRHITVLILTPTRLVLAHTDDHGPTETEGAGSFATATTETVPLSAVRGVMLAHVIADPENYDPGSLGRELTVTIGWGTVSRIDLMPASCADPDCEADHGYDGTITGDDVALRISADADGDAVLQQAVRFAAALSAALAG